MIYNYPIRKKQSGETWLLNETCYKIHANLIPPFYSGGVEVSSVTRGLEGRRYATYFNGILVAKSIKNYSDTNYTWVNDAYRRITFDTVPSGDLLTWLEENGVKQ